MNALTQKIVQRTTIIESHDEGKMIKVVGDTWTENPNELQIIIDERESSWEYINLDVEQVKDFALKLLEWVNSRNKG